MLQPQKEFQSQHILYCTPENPTTMQKSPGNYPVFFLLLIEKLVWSVCLFVYLCFVFSILWGSRRAWHFKLVFHCYRKWWERSQKYPSLGNERLLKPCPGCALLSGVLKMCWNKAWERGAVCRAALSGGNRNIWEVNVACQHCAAPGTSPQPCVQMLCSLPCCCSFLWGYCAKGK